VTFDVEEERVALVVVQQLVFSLGLQDRRFACETRLAAPGAGPQLHWVFLRQQTDVDFFSDHLDKRILQCSPP